MSRCDDGFSQDEDIHSPHLYNPFIYGNVTLDEAAQLSFVRELCEPFGKCITDKVISLLTGGKTDIHIRDILVEHKLTFSEEAKVHFVDHICDALGACILSHVDGSTLTGVTLQNPTINNGSFDTATINKFLDAITSEPFINILAMRLCTVLGPCIRSNVENNSFDNVTLNTSSIINSTISGSSADKTIFTHNIFSVGNSFQGELILDAEANESLCNAVETCVKAWIEEALSKALEALWLAIDALGRRIDRQDLIIDEINRIVWEIRCLTTDIVTCDGEIRGNRPMVTCDQADEKIEVAIRALPTCDDTPLEDRNIVACEQLEDRVRGLVTCDDSPLNDRPLTTCAQADDKIDKAIRAQISCDSTPVDKRAIVTCVQADDKINTAIRAQISCDSTPVDKRPIVTCQQADDKITTAIRAQLTCDNTPLNGRQLVACDQLVTTIQENSGAHKIYQSKFVISNTGATTKNVSAPLVLDKDSVVFVTVYGYITGGGEDHRWISASQLFIDGLPLAGTYGYPYSMEAEHLFITPDARSIWNVADIWDSPPRIEDGRVIAAGAHNVSAVFSGAPYYAYVVDGFIRIDVIPVSNIQSLSVTNT